VLISCSDENEDIPPTETEEGSWVKYSPIKWTHDGNPVEGTFCKVYSDGASYTLKLQCLAFSDEMFGEILDQFGFENFKDLRLPPENNKINVYINTGHEENVAYAYWGTIIITIRTSELNTSTYDYLFKHELTHEFEFLIEGNVNLGTELWFSEAIATYCAGWRFDYINTVADIEDWISVNESFPGQGNPIMIHKWEDFPEGANISGYNKVFCRTMDYLLNPKGLNKSVQDVVNLFYNMRDGEEFETSFQNNFGLSVKNFENEYYERMKAYLAAL
jgi:hypothetical protein